MQKIGLQHNEGDDFDHPKLDDTSPLKALKAALQLPKSEKIDLVKLQKYAKQLRVNIATYLVTMTIE